MERKGGNRTTVVTADEVRAALLRARTISSEEEKALRMRHGVGATDLKAPLPRAAGGNSDLADELMLIEMQLLRGMRARAQGRTTSIPNLNRVSAPRNVAKDKIVRALRKKK